MIAAHQAGAFVARAVRSALEQSVPPLEIVLVDDGSTDDINSALAPFVGRVTVIHQENRGEGGARNTAVRAASGDYVVILDADDAWLPDRLSRLSEAAMARPDLAIITTDAWLERDGSVVGRYLADAAPFEVADQRRAILWSNFVFIHAAVPRCAWEEVGGMDERRIVGVDWDLWRKLVRRVGGAGCIDEPLAHYRLWPGSMTADRTKTLSDRIAALDMALEATDLTAEERRLVLSRRAAERLRFAEHLIEGGAIPTRSALRAILLDPHPIADLRDRSVPPSRIGRARADWWAGRELLRSELNRRRDHRRLEQPPAG